MMRDTELKSGSGKAPGSENSQALNIVMFEGAWKKQMEIPSEEGIFNVGGKLFPTSNF